MLGVTIRLLNFTIKIEELSELGGKHFVILKENL
jgi:hypothetical protein